MCVTFFIISPSFDTSRRIFPQNFHKLDIKFVSVISTAKPENLFTGAHLGGGGVIHPSPQNEKCLPIGQLP